MMESEAETAMKPMSNAGEQICQICSDNVGKTVNGDFFVACDICSFPVCRPCYDYERKDGNKSCPKCKTRYKRLNGSPAIPGDKDEDGFDVGEFSYTETSQKEKISERMLGWHLTRGKGEEIGNSEYDKDVSHSHNLIPRLTITQEMAEETHEEDALNMKPRRKPPHFVLIHGMSLGSWCWYKIKCLIEVSGFTVTCIDLKSSGIDSSSADSLTSFDQYNQPLVDFLSSFPEQEQVILVGHSAGGLSLTSAIKRFPKKICLAVFIGASMLRYGLQTDEDMKDGVPDLSEHGDVYELGFGLGPENPPTSAIIKPEFRRQLLYHMSPQQECSLAALMMRPAPILALTTAKFEEEEEDMEHVARVYIKTLHDRVMKPEQQEAMMKRWPPSQAYELDSDHCPFFSNPFVLFGLLIKAAVSVGSI